NFIFAEYGFRYGKPIGQNESLQGFKGGDFLSGFFKKYYLSLANFQTLAREQIPFCRGGRGKVFLFLFSLKKKKGLNVFVILVEHSATPSKTRSQHTL